MIGGGSNGKSKALYALEQVLKTNMHVMIMSQARDGCIGNKINYLKIHSRSLVWQNAFNSKHIHYHTEVDNKYAYIGEAQSTNISDYRDFYKWEYIAYIGDAENDLECMQKALYTGCPADAVPIIKEESNYICDAKGGYGAVYEFCMHILEKRNNI